MLILRNTTCRYISQVHSIVINYLTADFFLLLSFYFYLLSYFCIFKKKFDGKIKRISVNNKS